MVNCTDSSTFYFTQLMLFLDPSSNFRLSTTLSAAVIPKSTDGGNTWGDPVVAVSKFFRRVTGGISFPGHTLDKEWSAIDPSNPQKMYFSYTDTDFDNSGQSAACGKQARTAIEVVATNDGG